MILTTADEHKIALRHLSRAGAAAVILAHGFLSNKDIHLFRQIEKMLHKYYDVLSFDFRGHGASGGRFSWTSHEFRDLEAVIDFAEKYGYQKIGLLGFSVGAASSLIAAAQEDSHIKSIIAVSTPYDLLKIDFQFWNLEMLKDFRFTLGPHGKGKFVRLGNPFLQKTKPIEAVGRIAQTPILFIHGEKDWLIRPHHSEKLFQEAKTRKELKVMPLAAHAEMIFQRYPEEFERLCIEWFKKTLG